MKPLPLPLRVAAGLAVSARDRARELPKQLTGIPVTVASQVLQASMRLQQQVTELAIKGDEALSGVRPVDETPSWATFDEELPPPDELTAEPPADDLPPARLPNNGSGRLSRFDQAAADPWSEEEFALAHSEDADAEDARRDSSAAVSSPPDWLPDYDRLSLAQLRGRLRRFDRAQLGQLLSYERAGANRPSFTGMLQRRIDKIADDT